MAAPAANSPSHTLKDLTWTPASSTSFPLFRHSVAHLTAWWDSSLWSGHLISSQPLCTELGVGFSSFSLTYRQTQNKPRWGLSLIVHQNLNRMLHCVHLQHAALMRQYLYSFVFLFLWLFPSGWHIVQNTDPLEARKPIRLKNDNLWLQDNPLNQPNSYQL